MNHFFTILGIEPTNDINTVRKAYYDKLQEVDETDTMAMAKLHDAYKTIINYLEHKDIPFFSESASINPNQHQNIILTYNPDAPDDGSAATADSSIFSDGLKEHIIHLQPYSGNDIIQSRNDLQRLINMIVINIGKYQKFKEWQIFIENIHTLFNQLTQYQQICFKADLITLLNQSYLVLPDAYQEEHLRTFYALDALYKYNLIEYSELIEFATPSLLKSTFYEVKCSDGTIIHYYDIDPSIPFINTKTYRNRVMKKRIQVISYFFLLIILVIGIGIATGYHYESKPKPYDALPTAMFSQSNVISTLSDASELEQRYRNITMPNYSEYSEEEKSTISELQTSIETMLAAESNSDTEKNISTYFTLLNRIRDLRLYVNDIEARFTAETE